jgi:hypothetical protein
MSYEAVYAAVQRAFSGMNASESIERAVTDAFDISWLKSQAQSAVAGIESDLRRPFVLLRPRMFIDGNQWCALYGDNLQDGVAGFGDTPDLASHAFDKEWNWRKPALPPADAIMKENTHA